MSCALRALLTTFTHLLISTIFGRPCARFRNYPRIDWFSRFNHFANLVLIKLNVRTLSANEIYESCMFQPTYEFQLVIENLTFYHFSLGRVERHQ